MDKKTIRDIDVTGKRIIVRADFNIPLDKETGAITDDTRIRAVLPTIRYLIDNHAKLILCSHLGRPKGKVVEKLRLAPIAKQLSQHLGQQVITAQDCIGPEVEDAVENLKEGEVLLLENLRFHPEEEQNDPAFAQSLARLANIFVNDAFGTTHRAHASVVGIPKYLPAVAGFLIEKELDTMGKALDNSTHPTALLIGGAKVSDKIGLLENILEKVDSLLIGGGMACTFLKAQGYEVGESLLEEDKVGFAKELMESAKQRGVHLLLPVDVIIAKDHKRPLTFKTVPAGEVLPNWYIGDIGPRTTELFSDELKKCKTVIWNGTMGMSETILFAKGTRTIAQVLANLDITSIVGGGSTAEVVEEMGLAEKMTHVSTGGGASIRFLEGRTLPGVAALQDKEG